MAVVSMKQLLEAGVHFGHQTRRWNPKMAPLYLHRAQRHLYHRPAEDREKAGGGPTPSCVTWPPTASPSSSWAPRSRPRSPIKEEAARCGMFYVNARWLGGMMTNFKTMRTRVDRLNQLKKMQETAPSTCSPRRKS